MEKLITHVLLIERNGDVVDRIFFENRTVAISVFEAIKAAGGRERDEAMFLHECGKNIDDLGAEIRRHFWPQELGEHQ